MGEKRKTFKEIKAEKAAAEAEKKRLAQKTDAEKKAADLGLQLDGANQVISQERARRQLLEAEANRAAAEAGKARGLAVVAAAVVVVLLWWKLS